MRTEFIENGTLTLSIAEYVLPEMAKLYGNEVFLAGDDNGARCFKTCLGVDLDDYGLLVSDEDKDILKSVERYKIVIPSYISMITGSFFEANLRPWWKLKTNLSPDALFPAITLIDEGLPESRFEIFSEFLKRACMDLKLTSNQKPSSPAVLDHFEQLFA